MRISIIDTDTTLEVEDSFSTGITVTTGTGLNFVMERDITRLLSPCCCFSLEQADYLPVDEAELRCRQCRKVCLKVDEPSYSANGTELQAFFDYWLTKKLGTLEGWLQSILLCQAVRQFDMNSYLLMPTLERQKHLSHWQDMNYIGSESQRFWGEPWTLPTS
jgi:hypothetical protein